MALGMARLVVSTIAFDRWRDTLGGTPGREFKERSTDARRFAAHTEWAAKLLPFATKCLPRAMALSWMLRRRRIRHVVVIAVRPAEMRDSPDALHAWVEVAGETILGDLPGPWIETARLGG